MRFVRELCVAAMLLGGIFTAPDLYAAPGQSDVAVTDAVSNQLTTSHVAVRPGQTFQVAWDIKLSPGWHVYWRNPGDSGLAPLLTVRDPRFHVGSTTWPVPRVISIPPITNYGYEDRVVLLVDVTAPEDQKHGAMALPVRLEYLYCSDVCVPGRVDTVIPMGVAETAQANPDFAPLQRLSENTTPRSLPPQTAIAYRSGKDYKLVINASQLDDTPQRFIPNAEGWMDDSAEQAVTREGSNYVMNLPGDAHSVTVPDMVIGGVVLTNNGVGYRVRADLTAPNTKPNDVQGTLPVALLFAFLAGLILNLMPCVLPVLALKVFGLVHAHGNRDRMRHTLMYASGVITSFWVMAMLVVVLQRGGATLGWGFQMQNPVFVALLAALMVVLAMNFWGVFSWGGFMTRLAGPQRSLRESYPEAFVTGVLAVLMATPCTVPFMGTAMAYALSQSAGTTLAVFTFLGMGMVAPLVAVSALPGMAKYYPKPGAWMDALKQALGWPLMGTAVWLLWVFGNQTNIDLLALLLAKLTLMAFALWMYGQKPVMWRAVFVVLALACLGWKANSGRDGVVDDSVWLRWTPEMEAKGRAAGPVFVDFTADWCITCKVTEATVLNTERVQQLFRQHGVMLLKADWTRHDERITQELARHGRRGVPLYLLYTRGANEPVILPQLPTYSAIEGVLTGTSLGTY